MKPIPDLENQDAMAERGRRSVLMSLRNDALEIMRDTYTQLQSEPIGDMTECAKGIIETAERLLIVAELWKQDRSESLLAAQLKASIEKGKP